MLKSYLSDWPVVTRLLSIDIDRGKSWNGFNFSSIEFDRKRSRGNPQRMSCACTKSITVDRFNRYRLSGNPAKAVNLWTKRGSHAWKVLVDFNHPSITPNESENYGRVIADRLNDNLNVISPNFDCGNCSILKDQAIYDHAHDFLSKSVKCKWTEKQNVSLTYVFNTAQLQWVLS